MTMYRLLVIATADGCLPLHWSSDWVESSMLSLFQISKIIKSVSIINSNSGHTNNWLFQI